MFINAKKIKKLFSDYFKAILKKNRYINNYNYNRSAIDIEN